MTPKTPIVRSARVRKRKPVDAPITPTTIEPALQEQETALEPIRVTGTIQYEVDVVGLVVGIAKLFGARL